MNTMLGVILILLCFAIAGWFVWLAERTQQEEKVVEPLPTTIKRVYCSKKLRNKLYTGWCRGWGSRVPSKHKEV